MPRLRESGTRLRAAGYLGGLAGVVAALLAVATVAYAAISAISPPSGTVASGGSTQATFTLSPPALLVRCIVATVSPSPAQFTVGFDGLGLGALPSNCASQPTQVTMTVSAGTNAPPGNYLVTINEVSLLDGGVETSHQWPFTVVPLPTTTSTSSSTSSTITIPSTITIFPSPTTTTTEVPGITTTTISGPESNGGTATTAPPGAAPSSNEGPGGDGTADEDGSDAIGGRPGAGPGSPSGDGSGQWADPIPTPDDSGFLSSLSLTDQLRNQIARAVPLPLAQAVLSPFVIAEFLFRSMVGSAIGYRIPLVIAALFGTLMIWSMRREVDDDELALSPR